MNDSAKVIEQVLRESNRPMTIKEIVKGLEVKTVTSDFEIGKKHLFSDVNKAIEQNPDIFESVSGEIFLTESEMWKTSVKTFHYLKELILEENEQLILYLLFYKRISDKGGITKELRIKAIRNRVVHTLKSDIFHSTTSAIEEMIVLYPQLKRGFTNVLNALTNLEKDLFGNSIIQEILNVLDSFDSSYLPDEKFGPVYEYFIHKILASGKYAGIFTSSGLKEIIKNLIHIRPGQTLFDPFLGIGGFLTEFIKSGLKSKNLYGQELDELVYEIGFMNLILHGFTDIDNFKKGDSLLNNQHSQKFDYIITSPPFRSKIAYYNYPNIVENFPGRSSVRKDGTPLFLHYIISKLKTGGKAYILIPQSFFFAGGFVGYYREYLIKQNLVEAVIKMPKDIMMPYTRLQLSLLILNKEAELQHNSVHFIDTNKLKLDEGYQRLGEQIQAILTSKQSTLGLTTVSLPEILSNQARLDPDFYDQLFIEQKRLRDEEKVDQLSDLVKIVSGVNTRNLYPVENGIPLVKTKHLGKEIIEVYLNEKEEYELIPKEQKNVIINEAAILINKLGLERYPTIYKPSSQLPSICIDNSVFALIIKEKGQISYEYLYYQLYSPYVQEQFRVKMNMGSAQPVLKKVILSTIFIPTLDFRNQKDFINTQKANLIQIEKERVEERLKMIGYKEEVAQRESDIVKVLVHQLRPTLVGIQSQVDKIKRIVARHGIQDLREFLQSELPEVDLDLELTAGYIPSSNHSIYDLLKKMEDNALQLNDKLTFVQKVMSFNLKPDEYRKIDLSIKT